MFGFLKKKNEVVENNTMYAVANGTIIPISEVNDPVFSQKMMGDGYAVVPENGEIYAPIEGEVLSVFQTKHAIGLKMTNGLEILLHMGIDTVELNGAPFTIKVKEGDTVLRGQPLTFGRGRMLPVHAPTSGKVVAIAPHTVAHPSALSELSVIIEADGEDRWIERDGWSDYRSQSREALIERIHQFGVAGLGGAGFPTGVKLRGGGDNKIGRAHV